MNESKLDFKRMLLFSTVILLFALALTVWAWPQIPPDAQIPIHWNAQGVADNYGSKTVGLLMGPGTLLLLTVMLGLVPHIEPRLQNLQQSKKAYTAVWIILLLFMAVLHWITVRSALGYAVDLPASMGYLIGVLFMVIGNYLGKIRSNFMFGIRTPWTLSSDKAWNKTHRLGGWLFFTAGLLIFLSGFLHNGTFTFGLMMVTIFGIIAILFGYSWWVWRQDNT